MRPRLRTLLPLAGLAGMAIVVALAMRSSPPLEPTFAALPPPDGDRGPILDLGDARLVGVLTDSIGLPVADATLLIARRGRPIWTHTDERGRFELAELEPGPLEVAVQHPEFGARLLSARAGEGPVELRLGERLPEPERLEPPPAFDLSGRVELPTGIDPAGFELVLRPTAAPELPGTGIPRRALLDGEGRFHAPELERGEYELALLPRWARAGSWPDLLRGLEGAPLHYAHPSADGADLELRSVAGEISGRVLERDGATALEGAMVTAVPAVGDGDPDLESRRLPAVRTDAEGLFRLPLVPPGRYRVDLVAGDDRRRSEVVVPEGASADPGL